MNKFLCHARVLKVLAAAVTLVSGTGAFATGKACQAELTIVGEVIASYDRATAGHVLTSGVTATTAPSAGGDGVAITYADGRFTVYRDDAKTSLEISIPEKQPSTRLSPPAVVTLDGRRVAIFSATDVPWDPMLYFVDLDSGRLGRVSLDLWIKERSEGGGRIWSINFSKIINLRIESDADGPVAVLTSSNGYVATLRLSSLPWREAFTQDNPVFWRGDEVGLLGPIVKLARTSPVRPNAYPVLVRKDNRFTHVVMAAADGYAGKFIIRDLHSGRDRSLSKTQTGDEIPGPVQLVTVESDATTERILFAGMNGTVGELIVDAKKPSLRLRKLPHSAAIMTLKTVRINGDLVVLALNARGELFVLDKKLRRISTVAIADFDVDWAGDVRLNTLPGPTGEPLILLTHDSPSKPKPDRHRVFLVDPRDWSFTRIVSPLASFETAIAGEAIVSFDHRGGLDAAVYLGTTSGRVLGFRPRDPR